MMVAVVRQPHNRESGSPGNPRDGFFPVAVIEHSRRTHALAVTDYPSGINIFSLIKSLDQKLICTSNFILHVHVNNDNN